MPKKHRSITPRLLDLFRRQARGTGTHQHYTGWQRIRRSDPPSHGRSHLHVFGSRQLDILSDLQLVCFYFAIQLPGVIDIREQYPLALNTAPHELSAYDVRLHSTSCPGTIELAKTMRVRHPVSKEGVASEPNVITTNLLITFGPEHAQRRLLAVSCKSSAPRSSSARLRLQAAYWRERQVPWLLITPAEFDSTLALTLQRTAGWALGTPASHAAMAVAAEVIQASAGHRSLTEILQQIQHRHGVDMAQAQFALWQTLWRGQPPVDLRRGWRPHLPLRLMGRADWHDLNPVAARRSAWTSP